MPLYFTCKFNEFNRKYYGDVDSVYQDVWDTYKGENSIASWVDSIVEESDRVNNNNEYHFENPIAAYGFIFVKKRKKCRKINYVRF